MLVLARTVKYDFFSSNASAATAQPHFLSHMRRISSLLHGEAAGGGLVFVVFVSEVAKGSLERQGGLRS